MRKTLSLFAVLMNILCYAQNSTTIIINQNGNSTTNYTPPKNVAYSINGISSADDIGGVEVYALKVSGQNASKLRFTNFNNFNVKVYYEVGINSRNSPNYKTGTIVLEAGETKATNTAYVCNDDYRLIVRPMGEIKGTISNEQTVLNVVAGYLIAFPRIINCDGRANAMEIVDNMNSRKAYGHSNWRIPTNIELGYLNIDNSKSTYFCEDDWNRRNIHPSLLMLVCDK